MDKKNIYINCYSRTECNRITIPMAEGGHSHFLGFKGMDSDMHCRDYQYMRGVNSINATEISTALYVDKGIYTTVPSNFISLCNRGLHFCWDLHSVFYYYPFYAEVPEDFSNRYFIVMSNGNIESSLEKACTDSLIVLEEIPRYKIEKYKDIYNNILTCSSTAKTLDAIMEATKESGIHELVENAVDGFINFNSRSYEYEKIWL